MPITLKDVAEKAGVSTSAVSRTFTEGASVSTKTRRKVEKAASELGYSPNVLARSLTTRRTQLIGLVANNFENPVFLEVFDRFTRLLQARGLRPLIVNLSEETEPDKSVTMLRQYSVDGVIVVSSTLPEDFVDAFRVAQIPVVHAVGRPTDTPRVDVIGVANDDCGRLAAETLIARGYRRITFLGGPEAATSTEGRARGFLETANAAEGVTARLRYCASYSYAGGYNGMRAELEGDVAEAYFCGDDIISIGAMSALAEAGKRVPDDVGLIGVNDMEMARWSVIDLTTIRQPLPEIIEASVSRIIEIVRDPDQTPTSRTFHCELVERGTLRPLPDV
ncbi:MAG: LacI family DNA-binding transcriptional regulator [Pseudomonadota bacterium]